MKKPFWARQMQGDKRDIANSEHANTEKQVFEKRRAAEKQIAKAAKAKLQENITLDIQERRFQK
ncbi:MAG: hypothetical protein IJH92_08675 [Mogibacterium sp.]|nr:hypothetical protein [Mogibacterium sp.]